MTDTAHETHARPLPTPLPGATVISVQQAHTHKPGFLSVLEVAALFGEQVGERVHSFLYEQAQRRTLQVWGLTKEEANQARSRAYHEGRCTLLFDCDLHYRVGPPMVGGLLIEIAKASSGYFVNHISINT